MKPLDEAPGRLEAVDPLAAQLVKPRRFAGLTMSAAAAASVVPLCTAARNRTLCRSLAAPLSVGGEHAPSATPPPAALRFSGFGAGRDAFVTTLYVQILGQNPNQADLSHWSGAALRRHFATDGGTQALEVVRPARAPDHGRQPAHFVPPRVPRCAPGGKAGPADARGGSRALSTPRSSARRVGHGFR
jgi:hypothetical protein